MKRFIAFAIVLVAIMAFASSKKQRRAAVAIPQLAGEWRGTYCLEGGPFVNELRFTFGNNNTVSVIDGAEAWGDAAKGAYALPGDSLTGTYIYKEGIQAPVTIKAVVNKSTGKIEGTWEWIKGKGAFRLAKK
jgi:hypothetical protein